MEKRTVTVVATSDGFFNGTYRREGTVFEVPAGAEQGSVWFRPVQVDAVPQGEIEPEQKPRGRRRRQRATEDDIG